MHLYIFYIIFFIYFTYKICFTAVLFWKYLQNSNPNDFFKTVFLEEWEWEWEFLLSFDFIFLLPVHQLLLSMLLPSLLQWMASYVFLKTQAILNTRADYLLGLSNMTIYNQYCDNLFHSKPFCIFVYILISFCSFKKKKFTNWLKAADVKILVIYFILINCEIFSLLNSFLYQIKMLVFKIVVAVCEQTYISWSILRIVKMPCYFCHITQS